MDKMTSLQGIIPATITPFRDDETINEEALVSLLERNLSQGAKGFFVGGSSAECFVMTEEERIRLFEIASDFRDRALLIAHAGAMGTGEAERYAKEAARLGFDIIAATPPFYYRHGSKELYEYYQAIAEASGKPVLVYNFPGNTGVEFNLNDPYIQKLFCSDFILGVKHTNQIIFQMEQIKALNPNLIMMNGYDETFVAGLALGAEGAIGSSFNFTFPHFQRMYECFLEGDTKEALSLQIRANRIMEALYQAGLIPAVKYVLSTMGIDAGRARRPFKELTSEDKEMLDQVIKENLFIPE
ncbi:MAG: dihydrodipicolinate synthase family protein [Lachnospiraceae bacterium]|nr:dihydrodipicolinate synthase family protein [Lachnospiraceae bacterium]